jgi:predicted Zn-dependent peptidase
MAFERKELANGIFFSAVGETKFKSNLISLRFILPLTAETAAKNALLFPVLLRGSEKFPDIGSIRREEESIYDTNLADSVYKRGDSQILELRMHLLDNQYAIDGMNITQRAMGLMEDILLHPVTENGVFCEEYVESEKEKLIDDILAQVNDKRRYAMTRLIEEMFEDDAFGLSELGTVESVEAVCPHCLWKQYQELLSSSRIEIFAIGNFDFDALAESFKRIFGGIKRSYEGAPETKIMEKAREEIKTVYERQNITQGKLSLGFYTGASVHDEDYHVMQMLNVIFGAGVTSKLFLNVREKLSLCYYCGSSENGQKGYMTVNSGIEFANEKKAVDEILFQLDEIKNGNISEDELRDARLALLDAIGRVGDSTGNLLNWYFSGVMNGKLISPEEKKEKIESVTVADIAKKAKDIKLDTYYFLCGKEEEAK